MNLRPRFRLGVPFFILISAVLGQSSLLTIGGFYQMRSSSAGHYARHKGSYAPATGTVDLSPSKWNPADRERVEKLEMSLFAPAVREIDGRSGLISNTGSPIAVHAGIEALKQGGTAADAAATVA